MQIPVITITNRAQADIMESRDCNVRNRHIRDTRTNQRTDSPPLPPSLSLFLSISPRPSLVHTYMHAGDPRKFTPREKQAFLQTFLFDVFEG